MRILITLVLASNLVYSQNNLIIKDTLQTTILNSELRLNGNNIIGKGNININGISTLYGANLIHNESPLAAPELSYKGFRQSWRMGIDVANNGGGNDFVLLARDVHGEGVNDLIYMNRNKEGDNSINDTSGYPSLGIFYTPASPNVQTMFGTPELKPNRTTVGIRKAKATTSNYMLGFFETSDNHVDYGINNEFEHAPFLKVRGDISILSSDINNPPSLILNANPNDSKTNYVIKSYHSGITGYELHFLNDSNTFYKYNLNNQVSTFNHSIYATGRLAIGDNSQSYKGVINVKGVRGSGVQTALQLSAGDASFSGDATRLLFSNIGTTNFYNAAIDLVTTTSNPSFLNPKLDFKLQDNNTFGLLNMTTKMSISNSGNVTAAQFNGVALKSDGDVNKSLREDGTYMQEQSSYTIGVQAHSIDPEDNEIRYFGNMPKAPQKESNKNKVFIRQQGSIKGIEIYCYSETAGSNENWSLYLRINDKKDYLISTISTSTNERIFSNHLIDIDLKEGDYFEIKSVNPDWSINPTKTTFGGYIKIN
ncbi:hypothetical protein OE09_0030 [Flavobacteriaceae bacterium MAR_2010_72]|nr:hypothetical protein OE09_0030 [Flavobacteriaceae bacterium MAR_2010_72]TVZ58266.1 hypothetical protein NA63_0762 [Flavobacteriaceae bacterium MAR_2010_105]